MKMHEFLEKHPYLYVEILYTPINNGYRISLYSRNYECVGNPVTLLQTFSVSKELLNTTDENFDETVGFLLNNWYTSKTMEN